jgi:hypothetical protein
MVLAKQCDEAQYTTMRLCFNGPGCGKMRKKLKMTKLAVKNGYSYRLPAAFQLC